MQFMQLMPGMNLPKEQSAASLQQYSALSLDSNIFIFGFYASVLVRIFKWLRICLIWSYR